MSAVINYDTSICIASSGLQSKMMGVGEISKQACRQTGIAYLMGGLGGVVNSLDFFPASLRSLRYFYFLCVLSSQWKAVTVN